MNCQCRTCSRGKKVTSQRGLAEHLGIPVKDLRAAIAAGNGPRQFNPTDRTNPRYVVSVGDEWAHGRDDARGAA